jgi:hypothetical protein
MILACEGKTFNMVTSSAKKRGSIQRPGTKPYTFEVEEEETTLLETTTKIVVATMIVTEIQIQTEVTPIMMVTGPESMFKSPRDLVTDATRRDTSQKIVQKRNNKQDW